MTKKIFFLALLFIMALTLSAKKKQKETKQSVTPTVAVYMYGLSPSFRDTTVYITDVQVVDSAYFKSKHILGGLTDYVGQMDTYFQSKNEPRRTNTVFFKTTRKKAEKAYMKLRRRYADKPGIDLKVIPTGEFTFRSVLPENP